MTTTVYARAHPVVKCGPSRTKQSFKDQVNINSIISKHKKTGMVTHLNGKKPFYGDVSGITDYQTSLNVVEKAQELFGAMSAAVRERFGHNPGRMIDFLNDPKNLDEAIELGMVIKKPNPDGISDPNLEIVKSDVK